MKIIGEIFADILYFPLWWYSRGFILFIKKVFTFLQDRQKGLALIVWMKNIFTPMYGQTDWQGRLISVMMRFVQIIFRSMMMLIYLIFSIVFLLLWLVLPIFLIYQVLYQLFDFQAIFNFSSVTFGKF